MKRIALLAVIACGLATTGPLLAQDARQPATMRMHGMIGTGMGMGMQPSARMLLGMSESLGLTGEQVQRLEAIQATTRDLYWPQMEATVQAMRGAQELLRAEQPDWGSYEAQVRQVAEHHVEAHVALARANVEARNVLTADQRAQLDMSRKMMREMMSQMMMHGMMGGAMHGVSDRMPLGTPSQRQR